MVSHEVKVSSQHLFTVHTSNRLATIGKDRSWLADKLGVPTAELNKMCVVF